MPAVAQCHCGVKGVGIVTVCAFSLNLGDLDGCGVDQLSDVEEGLLDPSGDT